MRLARVGYAIRSYSGVGVVGTARCASSSLQSFRFSHHDHKADKKNEVVADKDKGVDGQEGREMGQERDMSEEEISSEWLSMERRVKGHRPTPKGKIVTC